MRSRVVIWVVVPLFLWLLSSILFFIGFTSLTMIGIGMFFVLFCFVFMLLVLYRTAWICKFISFTKFRNVSTIISSNIYFDFFSLPVVLQLHLCYVLFNCYTGPKVPYMCLGEGVWRFSCPVSNFSHTYLVKAHEVELAIGTDSLWRGIVRDPNHRATLSLISRNSLKVKCFSYPIVVASSASLCCAKDEGNYVCLFWDFISLGLTASSALLYLKRLILWLFTFSLLLGLDQHSLATFYILSGSASSLLYLIINILILYSIQIYYIQVF